MRPGEHASEGPGGTDGSVGQAPAQVAVAPVAPAQSAPDGNADGRADQQAGAVWDQPLPWATPQEDGAEQSTAQPTSEQAESPAEPSSPPAAQAAAVRTEGGDDAQGDAQGDAEAAGADSSVALWQAAAADQPRGAHAVPAPVGATAVAGHAVSKWLLGVAVAAGGLLAAVGVAEGLSSHRTAATAKEQPEPIVGPGKGLDEAGSPTPTPSPAQPPTRPVKGHPVMAGAGKVAAAAAPAVGVAAPHAQSDQNPPTTHAPEISPQRATVKSSATGQSGYLSVHTAIKSTNEYWSQSEVTVTVTKKLTALKVVLHVAQTGGVANTGVWTSLGDKATVHTGRASDGGADYVVTLNAGNTLDPGTYVFQFGYNHDKGTRDTAHDIWGVVTTAAGDDDEVYKNGRF
jgi:hypothetical protein